MFFKDNLELIVIVMNRFNRLLCANLNFVPINRLSKSYCNCSAKLSRECSSILPKVRGVLSLNPLQAAPIGLVSSIAWPGPHRQACGLNINPRNQVSKWE